MGYWTVVLALFSQPSLLLTFFFYFIPGTYHRPVFTVHTAYHFSANLIRVLLCPPGGSEKCMHRLLCECQPSGGGGEDEE